MSDNEEVVQIDSSNINEYIKKFIRNNLVVETTMSTEWEGEYQYATCGVEVKVIDPDTGKSIHIDSNYDSVRVE